MAAPYFMRSILSHSAELSACSCPEIEFLDITLTEDSSLLALCYSKSLLLADFKKTILFSGFKITYKNLLNKKT
jgi:hypothetical protein